MATHTISPAGDPFIAGGSEAHCPCACDRGWATIGHIVIDENGEEVEEFAQYLCRRCNA